MKNLLLALISSIALLSSSLIARSFPGSEISKAFFAKLSESEDGVLLRKNLSGKELRAVADAEGTEVLVRQDYKRLSWVYRTQDGDLLILIFDTVEQSWPGDQPITIVLTKENYQLIDWIETGGQPVFHWAEVYEDEDARKLRTLSKERGGGTLIEDFTFSEAGINRISQNSSRSLKLGTFVYE